MRNQYADTFYELADKNKKLVMICADISPAGSMTKFRKKYPERFINTGVSEQIMIGMAAGMAMKGYQPFAYSIANFSIFRPFEFVRVDLAYQNLPVTVVGVGGGLSYSLLGSTHHTMEDVAVACSIPNMTVLAPCDPLEVSECMKWCAQNTDGPVYLRLGKSGEKNYTQNAVDTYKKGALRYIVKGSDICLLLYGPTAMRIAFELKDKFFKDKSVSIVSCHTIKPLDLNGLEEVLMAHRKTIVIEEHVPHGGLASRVKTFAWEHQIDREIESYSLKDEFIHYFDTHEKLLEKHGLTADLIASNQ